MVQWQMATLSATGSNRSAHPWTSSNILYAFRKSDSRLGGCKSSITRGQKRTATWKGICEMEAKDDVKRNETANTDDFLPPAEARPSIRCRCSPKQGIRS